MANLFNAMLLKPLTVIPGMSLWIDPMNSIITKTYQTFTGATGSGTSGTKVITASADVSNSLAIGEKPKIAGTDIYTIASIATATINTVETLTNTYIAGSTLAVDSISQINDISGNGNNAQQGTALNEPIYNPTGINNLPSMNFDDNRFVIFPTITASAGFTIFIVNQTNAINLPEIALGSGSAALTNKIGITTGSKLFVRIINAGSIDSTTLNYPSGNNILALRRDSSDKIDASFNNASLTRLFSDVAQSGNSAWASIGIDSQVNSTDWSGAIGDVLIYPFAFTNAQITQEIQFLGQKYKIPTL